MYSLRKNLLSNVVQARHLIGLILKSLLPHDEVGLPLLFVLVRPSALLPKFYHVRCEAYEYSISSRWSGQARHLRGTALP
jgi:hypothetical protein